MKHSVPKLLRLSGKIVMAGLVLPFSALTKAEVTLDGTLGPAGSLTGPNFVIPDTVGQTVGTNLFHSFGLFNINTGESATFTGPAVIDTIISRVTGGSQSFIDGLLRSEIESANLWFINPAGVLFGQHASLDIQGSFHVSTADYLKLGDGGRFEATHPENSVLTTAPPEAFGFLDDTPAPITVDRSTLIGEEGETLSLVGGDILVQGATLSAPGGRINLASVASGGLAVLEDDLQMRPLREGEAIQQGDIKISQGSLIEVSGSGGTGVFIRGGRFTLEGGSNIETLTTGEDKGGDISVKATDSILVADSFISAETSGEGDAGNISIEAGSRELIGHLEEVFINDEIGFILVTFPSVISSKTFGLGNGNGGTIDIKARDTIKMSFSDIDTSTFSSEGDAGNIFIEAGSLEVMDDSRIISESSGEFSNEDFSVFNFGRGKAGTIDIKVRDTFKLSSNFTGNSRITTSTSGDGDAGDISIEAGSLEVMGYLHSNEFGFTPSVISSDTEGSGNGGTIDIKARDTIKVSFSRITTSTLGEGDAGDISIEAGSLELMDVDIISESSGFFWITDEGSVFIGNQGNAGTIDIKARDTIKMSDSLISTSTNNSEGNAGDISIEAGSLELMESISSRLPASRIVSESNRHYRE